ncbi:helix-turn-helix transcriptional regulator [Micromonospora sp. NPDC005652]|uniref:helix-turn-helix domain-containing protein n=1 Tax=Micromonospora sp. NPDC005652 TaxID=3157046 RepID=UPI0033E01270
MTSPHAAISPLARRIRLGQDIVWLRESRGLTQTGLATAIGRSRQAITRVENPLTNLDRDLVADHVRDILVACDVPPGDPEHVRVMELAWAARRAGWWESGHAKMGKRQRIIANIELGATVIREYHPYLPPGLTQTPAFARARASGLPLEDATVEGLVDGRLQRQAWAFDSGKLRYEVVLEEMAVRRPIAPPDVRRDQLLHLVKLAERDNVSVRVLTVTAPLNEGQVPTSPCSIYGYEDEGDPVVAVIDTFLQDRIIVDPVEVSTYSQLFDRLRAAALSDADSAAFIREAADAQLVGR